MDNAIFEISNIFENHSGSYIDPALAKNQQQIQICDSLLMLSESAHKFKGATSRELSIFSCYRLPDHYSAFLAKVTAIKVAAAAVSLRCRLGRIIKY